MMAKVMEFYYGELARDVGQALTAVEDLHGEGVILDGKKRDPEQIARVVEVMRNAATVLAAAAAELTGDQLALEAARDKPQGKAPEKVSFRE